MSHDVNALISEVRDRVAALGFELADLRLGGSSRRRRLQVRIDRPDARPGHGVTVDDCATASRALETWLDGAGLLGPRYVLEVSSPGLERPLRWRDHWIRFVGHEVSVKVPGRGRVRAAIVRVDEATDEVVLRSEGEEAFTVPLADALDARLVVDWERAGPTFHRQ